MKRQQLNKKHALHFSLYSLQTVFITVLLFIGQNYSQTEHLHKKSFL